MEKWGKHDDQGSVYVILFSFSPHFKNNQSILKNIHPVRVHANINIIRYQLETHRKTDMPDRRPIGDRSETYKRFIGDLSETYQRPIGDQHA